MTVQLVAWGKLLLLLCGARQRQHLLRLSSWMTAQLTDLLHCRQGEVHIMKHIVLCILNRSPQHSLL